MAYDETSDEEFGLGKVDITMVVVPGRTRAMLTKLLAGARVRAGLAAIGVVTAVAMGVFIARSWSTGRAARSFRAYSAGRFDPNAAVMRFGRRLTCPRLTIVSPDGDYARVDFGELASTCGTYGNHLTLILHRVHGSWLPQFEASSWSCPMSQLPQAVVTELQLCRS